MLKYPDFKELKGVSFQIIMMQVRTDIIKNYLGNRSNLEFLASDNKAFLSRLFKQIYKRV